MKKIVATRHEDKVTISVYEAVEEPMWERTIAVEDCANLDGIKEMLDHDMLEQGDVERLLPNEIEELKVQIAEALK